MNPTVHLRFYGNDTLIAEGGSDGSRIIIEGKNGLRWPSGTLNLK